MVFVVVASPLNQHLNLLITKKHTSLNLFIHATAVQRHVRKDKFKCHLKTCAGYQEEDELFADDADDFVAGVDYEDDGSSNMNIDHTSVDSQNFQVDEQEVPDYNNYNCTSYAVVYAVEEDIGLVNEYTPSDLASDVCDSTLQYLKRLKHQSKRSSVKKQEFAKMSMLLFDKRLDDSVFMSHLAVNLGFEKLQLV